MSALFALSLVLVVALVVLVTGVVRRRRVRKQLAARIRDAAALAPASLPRAEGPDPATAPVKEAPSVRIEWCGEGRSVSERPSQRPLAHARPRYPIVLVHGFLGFDVIHVGAARFEYFRGIAAMLRARGVDAHSIRIPPVARIGVRARHLARGLRRIGAPRVNMLAHSMGGLDARYAIAELGLAPQVASLTTLGTPHRGTPLADLGAALLERPFGLLRRLQARGIDLRALQEMAIDGAAIFNRAIPNQRGVHYACIVGSSSSAAAIHPLLVPGYLALTRAAGPNDGLVPANSQRWGEELREVDADHWAQVGWSKRFDAARLFDTLVHDLSERGF